jgi:hypothetical protein
MIKRAHSTGLRIRPMALGAWVMPAHVRCHDSLPRGPATTRPGWLGRGAERAHRPWSPRGGHTRGRRHLTERRGAGNPAGAAHAGRARRCRARWDPRGRTEAAARRRGGGVGSGRRRSGAGWLRRLSAASRGGSGTATRDGGEGVSGC